MQHPSASVRGASASFGGLLLSLVCNMSRHHDMVAAPLDCAAQYCAVLPIGDLASATRRTRMSILIAACTAWLLIFLVNGLLVDAWSMPVEVMVDMICVCTHVWHLLLAGLVGHGSKPNDWPAVLGPVGQLQCCMTTAGHGKRNHPLKPAVLARSSP